MDQDASARPARQGGLRLHAWLWGWTFRIALWVLPFRWVLALARRGARPRRRRRGATPAPAEVRTAVESLDRFVPRFTCLVQAMTAGVLLGRAGAAVEIVLGVPPGRGSFEAHAWLEYHDQVVVGGDVSAHAAVARIALGAD